MFGLFKGSPTGGVTPAGDQLNDLRGQVTNLNKRVDEVYVHFRFYFSILVAIVVGLLTVAIYLFASTLAPVG